jgi:hypothetical protein
MRTIRRALRNLAHTPDAGFDGIGDGNWKKGGLVDNPFINASPGTSSGLGRGIYATTYWSKARNYGDYVYLFEFDWVSKIKVTYDWDTLSSWRCQGGVDGAYMPAGSVGGAGTYDEFCLRGSKLSKAYLVRYPSGKQVRNWNFGKPFGLRKAMEAACRDCDEAFFMDNLDWSDDCLNYDIKYSPHD